MIFEYHIGDTQLYTSCIIDCILLLQSIVFSVTMDCLQRDNELYKCVQKAKLYVSSVKVTLYFLKDGIYFLRSSYLLTHEVRDVRAGKGG